MAQLLKHLRLLVAAIAFGSALADEGPCRSWGSHGTMYPAIGRRTISLIDANRDNRTFDVDIWYPAENNGEPLSRYQPLLPSEGRTVALDNPIVANNTDGGGVYPLLVFSHGSGGIRQQSAKLMEHLASWGFVIASPDHAGNSRNDPPGVDIPYTVADRPKDLSFVMDSLLSDPCMEEYHLDSSTDVGVFGHSMGGLTSLLIAPDDGLLSDSRVKAIMPISPAARSSGGILDLSRINVPTLSFGGVNDTVTPVENNIRVFEETTGLPRWNVILSDAGHSSFADICLLFDTISELFGEDVAYSMVGGGDTEQGKYYVADSFCENYDEIQTTIGYFAASFFSAMLKVGNDAAGDEERSAIIECMAEEKSSFPLVSTFDFTDQEVSDKVDVPSDTDAPSDGASASTKSPTPAPSKTNITDAEEDAIDGTEKTSSGVFSIRATNMAFLTMVSLGFLLF